MCRKSGVTKRYFIGKLLLGVLPILIAVFVASACNPNQQPPRPVLTTSSLEVLPSETREDFPAVTEGRVDSTPEGIPADPSASSPLQVILFIGDGMGAEHRQAAAWMGYGKQGRLVMDRLPVRGALRTTAAGDRITGSAAAATALASGLKTRNGLVGLNTSGEEVRTSFDWAQERGLAVGLVTNTQLTHATPAAFAAHSTNRWNMNEIAPQLLQEEIDVLLGGGENYFLPATSQGCHPEPGKREDSRNLVAEAEERGYQTLCRPEQLQFLNHDPPGKVLGLFADEGIPRPFQPSLAELTSAAVAVLSRNPEGFVLVVESGQIDWASHGNVASNAIQDTLALDEAVLVGLEFARSHPNTLLIVTADHETGGMDAHSLPTGKQGEEGPFTGPGAFVFYVTWSTDTHTNLQVPVTAQGPGAHLLAGENENTIIHEAILEALQN
jgi:alkaline phosphatase